MHDWFEDIDEFRELLSFVCESVEKVHQGLKVPVVLIRLCSGDLDFFLELGERSSVCRLVLLKEFENLLDSL